jgi:plasmid stabilization system protein ParE
MKVRYSEAAQSDLEVIYNYITEHSPSAAHKLKGRLKERAGRLGRSPNMGERTAHPNIRVLKDSRYPYLIFYTVAANEIVILHVRHAARQHPQ